MAEGLSGAKKSEDTEKVNCSTHELPALIGCRTCLRFLCEDCLKESEEQVCIGKKQHDISRVQDVLNTLESKYDRTRLQMIMKGCEDLEKTGRSVHDELQNEKNRIDEMFEVQKNIIEDHLKQVREKLQAANQLLNPEGASPIQHYTTLVKTTPSILLKLSGGDMYSVQVETGEEVKEIIDDTSLTDSSTIPNVPEMKSKSFKLVSSFGMKEPVRRFAHELKAIVTRSIKQTDSGASTEFKFYKLINGQLSNSEPIIKQGNQTLKSTSVSGNTRVTKERTKRERKGQEQLSFTISAVGLSDQEIKEEWCQEVESVCALGDEWILFFLKHGCIKFYSRENFPCFSERKEQNIKIQSDAYKITHVNETQFCVFEENRLHLYEFKPVKISVTRKWSADIKTGSNSSICYSKLYDLILITKPGGLLMIKRQTGRKSGFFPTPVFAETPPINMMINDQILFDMGEKILLYQLVDKEKDEQEERPSWRKLSMRVKNRIPNRLLPSFVKQHN